VTSWRVVGPALALLVAVSIVPAAAAAGPGRPCRIVTDATGDAHGAAFDVPAAPPELDLVEASKLVSASRLAVTIRVTPNSLSSTTAGQVWRFGLSDGERRITLVATRGPDGTAFTAFSGSEGANQPPAGVINGRIDLARGRIEMSAALAQLGVRPTSVFRRFTIDSSQGVATTGQAVGEGSGLPVGHLATQSTTFGADSAETVRRQPLNSSC